MLSLAACGGNSGNGGNGGNSGADTDDSTATSYKDTLTWAQGADVTSLDPHQGKETPAVEVTCQIFDTLVVVDPETNEIKGQIAESWEQTDDLTYVFKIRQGIKFHDGSDLTSEDVVASITYAKTCPEVNLYNGSILTVEAVDEYTVKMTTDGPSATLLYDLCHHGNSIVPKELTSGNRFVFKRFL